MEAEWLKIAKKLPLAQKTRVNCECGSGKTKVINHNQQGYSYFCFRCDDKDFVGKGKQTLEELAELKRLNEEAANTVYKIELPPDFTKDIPLIGRLWLYQAGVTESLWKQYGFGWSEKMQRVVMPVYKGDKLVWFQARAVHAGQKPKYINPTGDRSNLIYWTGDTTDKSEIVVVEDILSAIRVGNTKTACSLLGTKITTRQAGLLGDYARVTTWLDNDEAGIKGAYTVRRLVGMVTEVRNIRTDSDPKTYTNSEISEILK